MGEETSNMAMGNQQTCMSGQRYVNAGKGDKEKGKTKAAVRTVHQTLYTGVKHWNKKYRSHFL